MPQRRTSIKGLRKDQSRRLHNLDIKTDLRKAIKNFLTSITKKDKTEAQANLKLVFKKLDKTSKSNLIHKNTVARRKSRFSKLIKTLA